MTVEQIIKRAVIYRQTKHITQEEVAKSMETTQPRVSSLESGANVSIKALDRYLASLGLRLVIYDGDVKREKSNKDHDETMQDGLL